MSKEMEFIYPSCSTCRHKISMKYRLIKEKSDNGGIHYRYDYEWEVNCKKEGIVKEMKEGTKHRIPLPSCSLWEFLYE